MSQRKASKKSRYSFSFLFVGFVVLQNSSHLLWIFNKYVPKNIDWFLVFKNPGTVTIAPVAAAPVPIAVDRR